MNFTRVVELLGQRKVVTIGVTSYALIDGRIYWVKVIDEEVKLINHDPQMKINEFVMFCDAFDESKEDAVVDLPEEVPILSPCGEYNFAKMPKKQECPHCLSLIKREDAVLEEKYAHCPNCGYQIYRATRLDGRREDGLIFTDEAPRLSKNHPRMPGARSTTNKPKEPTLKELLESEKLSVEDALNDDRFTTEQLLEAGITFDQLRDGGKIKSMKKKKVKFMVLDGSLD